MIKINLLYDVASQTNVKKSRFFSTVPSGTTLTNVLAAPDENIQIASRVGAFAAPLILLLCFRWYLNSTAESNFKRLQAEQAAIQAQLKALDPAVKELEKYQEEKNKLNSQLQAIKLLSRERLKNVKSLDVLQTIIPIKAWLTNLKIIDKGLEIDGMATDDLVVADFMQGLSSSIYFSNIKLIGSEEYKRPEGNVKKFKIKCNLENL